MGNYMPGKEERDVGLINLKYGNMSY